MNTKTNILAKSILGALVLSSLISATTLADDYMYVNATHLNVRTSNTFRSSIVATVDNGYKVTVLETLNNGWKKVLLENGAVGYMNGRYLSEQAPYFEKAAGSLYVVNVPQAFVRADGLVRKVAVLHKGDTLQIMDEKVFLGKWLRVKITSWKYIERVGYISKKLVTVDENGRYISTDSWNNPDTDTPNDSWISDSTPMNTDSNMNTSNNTNTSTVLTEEDNVSVGDDFGDIFGGLLK